MKHTIFAGNWYYDVLLALETAKDGDEILTPHPLIAGWAENEKEKSYPNKQIKITVTPRVAYRSVLPNEYSL